MSFNPIFLLFSKNLFFSSTEQKDNSPTILFPVIFQTTHEPCFNYDSKFILVLEEGELFEPNSERKKEEETKLNKFAQPVQLFIAYERV